jgi:hypothetical protein
MKLSRGLAALAALSPPAFLYEYLRLTGDRNDALHIGWNSPAEKIPALLNLVRTYDTAVDAALLLLLAFAVLAAVWRLRPVRAQPEFAVISATLFALFLIAPRELFASSASGVDVRFVVPAALLLLLGLRLEGGGRARPLLFAALVSLLAIRMGFIWQSWEGLRGQMDALAAVTSQLPHERTACVVHPLRVEIDASKQDLSLSHRYCLAVITRGAVVPLLFTDPGAQPIEFRDPPPDPVRNGYLVDAEALQSAAVWEYCDSFVTYREPAAVTGALQGRAGMTVEAGPYRLWRNLRSGGSATRSGLRTGLLRH